MDVPRPAWLNAPCARGLRRIQPIVDGFELTALRRRRPRFSVGVLTVGRKCRRAKAKPEPDLRYRSNANARCSSLKAMTTSMCHGRPAAVTTAGSVCCKAFVYVGGHTDVVTGRHRPTLEDVHETVGRSHVASNSKVAAVSDAQGVFASHLTNGDNVNCSWRASVAALVETRWLASPPSVDTLRLQRHELAGFGVVFGMNNAKDGLPPEARS
jgi:hypothetical protein